MRWPPIGPRRTRSIFLHPSRLRKFPKPMPRRLGAGRSIHADSEHQLARNAMGTAALRGCFAQQAQLPILTTQYRVIALVPAPRSFSAGCISVRAPRSTECPQSTRFFFSQPRRVAQVIELPRRRPLTGGQILDGETSAMGWHAPCRISGKSLIGLFWLPAF